MAQNPGKIKITDKKQTQTHKGKHVSRVDIGWIDKGLFLWKYLNFSSIFPSIFLFKPCKYLLCISEILWYLKSNILICLLNFGFKGRSLCRMSLYITTAFELWYSKTSKMKASLVRDLAKWQLWFRSRFLKLWGQT